MSDHSKIIQGFLDQFLTAGGAGAKAIPDGFTSVDLTVKASPAWPDGERVPFLCHKVGRGPAVLLVHGWQSQAADLASVAQRIASMGYTVWLPDLPGHGHAGGKRLSVPLAGEAVQEVARHAGPFAAVVSHSYGGAALVHALAAGLSAERVVLVSPPTHYGQFLRQVAAGVGLPGTLMPAVMAEMKRMTGVDPDEVDMHKQVLHLKQPALLIHSTDDTIVPCEATEAVARVWPGARWHQVMGLGHFKILADRGVLEQVAAFIGPAAPRG